MRRETYALRWIYSLFAHTTSAAILPKRPRHNIPELALLAPPSQIFTFTQYLTPKVLAPRVPATGTRSKKKKKTFPLLRFHSFAIASLRRSCTHRQACCCWSRPLSSFLHFPSLPTSLVYLLPITTAVNVGNLPTTLHARGRRSFPRAALGYLIFRVHASTLIISALPASVPLALQLSCLFNRLLGRRCIE